MSAATGREKPREAWRGLDQAIAGNAFDRAAAALADAAEAARSRDLDRARRLAAKAVGRLGWAGGARNGLRYVRQEPPSCRGADGAGQPTGEDAGGGCAPPPAGPAVQ